jgi:serine/threonine protein kinase
MGIPSLPLGSMFGNRFLIEAVAGQGGMGTVYRAIDQYNESTVALKLLHTDAAQPEEVERFGREAQLLSELHHPGIVAHVAHGQTPEGLRYLVMEWLQGQDLSDRLLRGPLSLHDSLRLLTRVAQALSAAHTRGIIHRDTTRKNKLCSPSGDTATHRRRTDHAHALHTHSPH